MSKLILALFLLTGAFCQSTLVSLAPVKLEITNNANKIATSLNSFIKNEKNSCLKVDKEKLINHVNQLNDLFWKTVYQSLPDSYDPTVPTIQACGINKSIETVKKVLNKLDSVLVFSSCNTSKRKALAVFIKNKSKAIKQKISSLPLPGNC